MSNDRHLEENKGTMGSLFRRMTMASLGLDAMDDVSAQSFEVIDRADSFAQRLLGGVTRMMPTDSFERIGVATSSDALWKELYSGILTTDGPKNATDVGEWQYWLDAVLLMLFDEDEEEAAMAGTAAKGQAVAKSAQSVQAHQSVMQRKQEIRERVAQLNASGVRPSMLRQLSTSKQREIAKAAGLFDAKSDTKAADLSQVADKYVSSEDVAIGVVRSAAAHSYSDLIRDFSTSLIRASEERAAVDGRTAPVGSKRTGRDVLSVTSEQVLASHVVERANRLAESVRASVSGEPMTAEAAGMFKALTENVNRFSRSSHLDGSDITALHEMQRLVSDMSSKGLVGADVVRLFKESSRAFAARSLENVLSKDFAGSLLLNKIESGVQSIAERQDQAQNISVSARAARHGEAVGSSFTASQAEAVERRLSASLEDFSKVVRSYVDNAEESASSVRWSRAVERFEQMQGISEEQDRVLLRDVVESASQLEASGIVPKGTVDRFVKRATDQVLSASNAEAVRAGRVDMLQKLTSGSEQALQSSVRRAEQVERMVRRFNSLIENVSGSISNLVTSLEEAGFASEMIEPLVREMSQVGGGSASLEEGVRSVEQISRSLDSFVSRALSSLPAGRRADVERRMAAAKSATVTNSNVSEQTGTGVDNRGAESFRTVSGITGRELSTVSGADGSQSGIDDVHVAQTSVERSAARISAGLDSFVERATGMSSESGYAFGFDDLDGSKTFVAPESAVDAGGTNVRAAAMDTKAGRQAGVEEIRRYVEQVQALQRETEAKYVSALSAVSKEAAVTEAARAEIAKAIESRNVEEMIRVRNEVGAQVSSALNAQLEEAAQRMENARRSFDVVTRQVRELEHVADIASMLHVASNQAYATKLVTPSSPALSLTEILSKAGRSVSLGNVSFDKAYLPVLNETISAYARLRDEYSKFDMPSLSNLRIEETTRQLDRMMSLVQPSELSSVASSASTRIPGMQQELTVSGAAVAGQYTTDSTGRNYFVNADGSSTVNATDLASSVVAAPRIGSGLASERPGSVATRVFGAQQVENTIGLDRAFGYEEIVPETMDKVQSRGENSIVRADNYTSMLGARRALELHASDLVQGRSEEIGAFKDALGSAISARTSTEPFEVYTINEQGERIKVVVNGSNAASQGMKLRQPIGDSYQPVEMRGTSEQTASLDIQKLDQIQSISGAEHFVPVMLGALSAGVSVANAGGMNATGGIGANASSAGQYAQTAGISAAQFANTMSVDGMNGLTAGIANVDGLNGISGISSLAGVDGRYEGAAFDGDKRLLNVSLGGTNISMTPEAYVQAVAQPQVSNSARSLAQNSDVLYNAFASVLSQQGASRSLNTLRRVFFEKLSEAGKTTARGWVGLNSQSFASLLGIDAGNVQNVNAAAYDAEKGEFVKASAASPAESFGNEIVSSLEGGTARDAGYAGMDAAASQTYVSGSETSDSARTASAMAAGSSAASVAYGMQFLRSQGQNAQAAQRQNSGELLGHIESLLDYVEDVSTRNTGVFSTNDVVKVLVEQLPRESYLGERGLPKWRQKDTRTRQAEEARELREALRKIGATPVQGMQRIHDKKYVSPNLVPQDNSVAPLFSGGVESGSTPAGAANSSGYNSNQLESTGIPQADLEVLAREVCDLIYENLEREYKRRRSE